MISGITGPNSTLLPTGMELCWHRRAWPPAHTHPLPQRERCNCWGTPWPHHKSPLHQPATSWKRLLQALMLRVFTTKSLTVISYNLIGSSLSWSKKTSKCSRWLHLHDCQCNSQEVIRNVKIPGTAEAAKRRTPGLLSDKRCLTRPSTAVAMGWRVQLLCCQQKVI